MRRSKRELTLVCMICAAAFSFGGNATAATSPDAVGYMSVPHSTGVVVRAKVAGDFSQFDELKPQVVLKDALILVRFSPDATGKYLEPCWIRPLDGSTLTEASVNGRRLELTRQTMTNGCLVTRDFGDIPVAFHKDEVGTNWTYRCVLDFSEAQLTKLQKWIAREPERGKPSTN